MERHPNPHRLFSTQLGLPLRQRGRGGARPNAGRKRGTRVSHRRRAPLAARFPVHVTLRVHFAVLSNHLHLIVEASDERALACGMQGLAIRMARSLNREQARKGPVFADRYHAHLLRSLAEVRNAVAYVLGNFAKHLAASGREVGSGFVDPCSSDWPGLSALVAPARTWLLNRSD